MSSILSEMMPKPELGNFGYDDRIYNAFVNREFVRNGVIKLQAFKQFIKVLGIVTTPDSFVQEFIGGVVGKSNDEIRDSMDMYARSIRGELHATNSSPAYKAYSEGFSKALMIAMIVHNVSPNKELMFMDSLSLTLKTIFFTATSLKCTPDDLMRIFIDSLNDSGHYESGMISVVAEDSMTRGPMAFILDQPLNYTAVVSDIIRNPQAYSVLVPSMVKSPDMDGVDLDDQGSVQGMLMNMLSSAAQPLSILQGNTNFDDLAIIIVNDSNPTQHLMNIQRAMITATGAGAFLDFPTYNSQVIPVRIKDIHNAING